MLPYDYGILYDVNTQDPLNSNVYVSWLSSGTSVINKADRFSTLFRMPNNFYVEDNSDNQEVCYLSGTTSSGFLCVNRVTGTTAIYLADQIEATPAFSYDIIGTKKVNDTLYYIYGVDTDTLTTTDEIVIDFRRISALSGNASTDTSIASETITIETGALWTMTKTKIGRSMYISIIFNTELGLGREGRLYQINLDEESLSQIETLVLSGETNQIYGGVNGLQNYHGVLENQGNVKWWIDYFIQITDPDFPNPVRFINKVYYDGTTTEIFNVYPYSSGLISLPINRNALRYNYRDTKIVRSFTYDTTDYFLIIDSTTGVSIEISDANYPDIVPVKFVSKSVFPKIGLDSSLYYWLDDSGKILEEITLDGVLTIRGIYPTLDTVNGGMYVNARMTDATDKLVLVNSTTGDILAIYNLIDFPYTSTPTAVANNGNFFISKNLVFPFTTTITYILEVPPINLGNDVMMIVEMN